MSGTTAKPTKVTGLSAESATVASGGVIRLRWASVPGGTDEVRLEWSADAGKSWQSWGRSPDLASFQKFGAPDGGYVLRIVARRGGSDIAGSASDPVAVRVGPVPATQPAPTPTPAPSTPAYATAAELAALRDRVAALEARAASPIQASGTIALAVQGQADIPATATLTLTPVVPAK